ncbi:DUF6538 domain-containing protein [Inquilinus limosus]|uniref:Tyr recombinase domain-containing protein n=1 Tax=Inquilinus limosus MP06 TaxID=1398085 RepID=A0A0A0DBQ4_9PROT|nr:DUF6538 domain-containing protein [Inquilinus limosus]KGM35323.1 hypothetical protein P409_05270 [Inquilinus limosus MP06]
MSDLRYLLKRGHSWYFRMAVPRDLRATLKRPTIVQAMNTRDLTRAKAERWAMVAAWTAQFQQLRVEAGTRPDGRDPREVYRQTLQWAREVFPESPDATGGPDDIDPSALGLELEAQPFLDRLDREEFDGIPANLSPQENARLAALTARMSELAGRRAETPPEYRMSFEEAAAGYIRDRKRDPAERPTEQTIGQAEAVYRLFGGFWKERPFGEVKGADAAEFLDIIGSFSPTWGRSPETKKRTFEELRRLFGGQERGLSNRTLNRYIGDLSAAWEWAEKRGGVKGKNPFDGLWKKTASSRQTGYLPFSVDQLNVIFKGTNELRRTPYRRAFWWVPRIALFSGMRVEEICALDRDEVSEEDGVPFFDITAAKTVAGIRRVPIHSALIGLGLLDDLPKAGPIFPELKPGGPDEKRSHYYVKRFSALTHRLGISQIDPATGKDRLAFHSFRKCVGTALERAQVAESDAVQALGHEKLSMSYSVYSLGLTLPQLRDRVVEKIVYPKLDLEGLRRERPDSGD